MSRRSSGLHNRRTAFQNVRLRPEITDGKEAYTIRMAVAENDRFTEYDLVESALVQWFREQVHFRERRNGGRPD